MALPRSTTTNADPVRSRSGRARIVLAILVVAPLSLLSAMTIVPPWSMVALVLAVGATELSPLLALADLLALAFVWRLLHTRRPVRLVLAAVLSLATLAALQPAARFGATAHGATAQLGTSDIPLRFSFLGVFRGLGPTRDVVDRTVLYRAADGSPLAMRLYRGPAAGARPAVVVIYGGAWRSGSATQANDASRALAHRGFTVAAVDYRHAPRSRHPAQLDDVRATLALVHDSAAAWGIDTMRIALLGRSSGGHLAELAAYAPGVQSVRAVVAVYAPFDLVQGYRDTPSPDPIGVRAVLRDFVGGTPDELPARYHAASPSSYVRPGLPPTLLLYGGRDHVVKPEFNRGAAAALRRAGVRVVQVELPWAEHGFDLGPAGLGGQLALRVVTDFLQRELATPTASVVPKR